MKSVDNPISWAVDFCLVSLLEGFITEFAVDQRKSFNEAERVLDTLNLSEHGNRCVTWRYSIR